MAIYFESIKSDVTETGTFSHQANRYAGAFSEASSIAA
jgi:hypothetical protein